VSERVRQDEVWRRWRVFVLKRSNLVFLSFGRFIKGNERKRDKKGET